MKKQRSLIPLTLAVEGLLIAQANANYSTVIQYHYQDPPYATSVTESTGYLHAQYNGTFAARQRLAEGYDGASWEVDINDTVSGTLVAATWTWNPGSYSDILASVWDPNDPNNIWAQGSLSTPNTGAYCECY